MLAPRILNEYVLSKSTVLSKSGTIIPFFPIHDSTGVEAPWKDAPYVVYDWISIRTPTDLYIMKTEHVLYSIRGNIDQIYKIRDETIHALDHQDDSARDLNQWQEDNDIDPCATFHTVRAWQTGRVVEPTQTKQYYSLPVLIEYVLIKS